MGDVEQLPTTMVANLIIANLDRFLNDRSSNRASLDQALRPFLALEWSHEVLSQVGTSRLNLIWARVRSSPATPDLVRTVIEHIRRPLIARNSALDPVHALWRPVLDRFQLAHTVGPLGWSSTLTTLCRLGLSSPELLAGSSLDSLRHTLPQRLFPRVSLLWQASRLLPSASSASRTQLSLLVDVDRIVPSLRAGTVESSAFGQDLSALTRRLNLSDDFASLGPAAKVRRLEAVASDQALLSRFLETGANANVLQQVRSSLPAVAAGLQGYLAFCRLIRVQPFPPLPATLCQWSTLFRGGRTFSLYLSHLEKVCAVLGVDAHWRTAPVIAAVRGLINLGSARERFHNVLSSEDFQRFMRHETFTSEFGRLGYVSYLFVLRLQSEALPIVYAFDGEPLLSRSGPFAKSTMGLRRVNNEDRLVLRLAFRKNTRSVTIALRPCFCTDGGIVPRALCPIHAFWTAVTAHTRPGEFLFPTYRPRNLTRVLRRALSNAGVSEGHRFTPHCFRRGGRQ